MTLEAPPLNISELVTTAPTLQERQMQQLAYTSLQAAIHARRLLHGGHEEEEEAAPPPPVLAFAPASLSAAAAPQADEVHESTHTLKWVFAAVIFAEALLGLALPVLLSWNGSWFGRPAFLSLLNCFAGGVFLTFGIMHLLPDAAEDAEAIGITGYPTAYLLCAVGFFSVFFVQKVLSPMLTPAQQDTSTKAPGGTCCSANAGAMLGQATTTPANDTIDGHKRPKVVDEEADAVSSSCDCNRDAAPVRWMWLVWICPALLWFGLCTHSVFEGLAVGLQETKAGVVTVAVAMIVHKWVESLALSSLCLRAGARWWQLLIILLPFAAMGFIGVAIGVAVTDSSAAAEMVLFALISGAFIYIGGYEIVHSEFASNCTTGGSNRLYRLLQYFVMFCGALLVALLQLVH